MTTAPDTPHPEAAKAKIEIPDPGLALCLSGGGFRATLFHLGALRRLNELGVLARVCVFVSVSGGSILNGVVATRWRRLIADENGVMKNFDAEIGVPVMEFCSWDLRTKLLFWGRLNPLNWPTLLRQGFAVPANLLGHAYDALYERQNLVDLPTPGKRLLPDVKQFVQQVPRFVFCATSIQTGACWQFHGGVNARMGEFYEGYCDVGSTSVSDAVAASSAFPPGFAGLELDVPAGVEWSRLDPWGVTRVQSTKRPDMPRPGARTVLLTDGGVYDNLGVEPIWDRCGDVLVSDAGRPFASKATVRQAIIPRLQRAAEISAEQVGAVRKRWLVEQLRASGKRKGTIWAINTRIEDFKVPNAQGNADPVRQFFPEIRTDLNAFTDGEMWSLQNHGYSMADAAVRTFGKQYCTRADAPFNWPNKDWVESSKVEAALASSGTRAILHDILSSVLGR